MISIDATGIHTENKQIIAGVDATANIRLADTPIAVVQRMNGTKEISLTIVVDDDVILG